MGPRAGLALLGKREISCSCCDLNYILLFRGERGRAEGVEWPGCEINQSLLSDAKGKMRGAITSLLPHTFHDNHRNNVTTFDVITTAHIPTINTRT